jgi:hypothetical protein
MTRNFHRFGIVTICRFAVYGVGIKMDGRIVTSKRFVTWMENVERMKK